MILIQQSDEFFEIRCDRYLENIWFTDILYTYITSMLMGLSKYYIIGCGWGPADHTEMSANT